jgi:hypothetical protein
LGRGTGRGDRRRAVGEGKVAEERTGIGGRVAERRCVGLQSKTNGQV